MKIDKELENELSMWIERDRDRMRDFMNFMNWGFNHQLDLNTKNPIKDELEYKDKVYKLYVYDRIMINSVLEKLLDNDLSGISFKTFYDNVKKDTNRTYNSYVLDKGYVDDEVEFDYNF